MASIFKKSRDKGKKNRSWWIEYVDADGSRAYAKGFTDKGLTEQLAAKLETEVLLRRRGMIDPEQERLLAIKQSVVQSHLEMFERAIDNNTPKHRKLTMTRIRRLIDRCGIETIGQLNAEKVVHALKDLRKAEDLGARTYNHYLQAMEEVGTWLVSTKRLLSNPVAGIARLNAETDVRHKRRALCPEEVMLLVESARTSGEDVQGYDGELRSRVYLMSFMTGLRRQELASLTPRSFYLDAPQPILKVKAACSKHRREDTLPIHPALVTMVRDWVIGMDPDTELFPRLDKKKTWLMVKKDLERVGIPYETSEGIADFHAAGRHSHVTGLLRNGATLVQAKELARHADVRMTMKYTHIGLDDQAQALSGLPVPLRSPTEKWSEMGRELGGDSCQSVASDGNCRNQTEESINDATPLKEGVASSDVTYFQEESSDVNSGGGGNCMRWPFFASLL